ncbi:carbohydrate ABC transporter permease [Paenibacillus chungangensis]|uniref:Carbohydrate ABC transporter permease n=1 Tax=Paenibacillus chungangensis TaxID=696535 RepID=A0ABW3HST8_9BACL
MQTAIAKYAARPSSLRSLKRKKYMWAYLFTLPQLLMYVLFTLYPILMSYVYVLFDWYGIGPLEKFVGLDNVRYILQNAQFWQAARISFLYIAGVIALVMPASLLMAIILNSTFIKGKVVFRTAFFIPVVSTTAIVGVIMRYIFGNEGALVNSLLMKLGIIEQPVHWLLESTSALIILILVGAWLQFGMKMIYWLAALQALPQDVYEAGKIDGCNAWKSFRHITLPLLMPAAAVILLLSIVNGFNVFDLAMTLTGGGPYFATTTVDLFIYKLVFTSGLPRIGVGSAAGIVFGLMVFAVTLLLSGLVKVMRDRYGTK